MPLLPEDELLLRLRFPNYLTGTLDISSFPPGWMRPLMEFLEQVSDFSFRSGIPVRFKTLKCHGIVVRTVFDGVPTDTKDLIFLSQKLKRQVVMTCNICGARSDFLNPVRGQTYCTPCLELLNGED